MKPFIHSSVHLQQQPFSLSLNLFMPEWFDQQMADKADNENQVYFHSDSRRIKLHQLFVNASLNIMFTNDRKKLKTDRVTFRQINSPLTQEEDKKSQRVY